ncbi:peptide chain release factor N(5)-glutamine methyltransferase [Patescibacteria group bacterium]|nr:peptide chain release factor N(5)-glutamine methyltransferase [Patescibacteria group bacterium]
MEKDERWLVNEKYGGVECDAFDADRKRLARGEPLAYVIGWQPFLGLRIHLDSRPLIPRPETEWWAEELTADSVQRTDTPLSFLDLCAGSGAIGCAALARLPHAKVRFGELDPAHEDTIRKNIRENGLDASRASIGIGDLFAPFKDERFDIIAANPPYVPAGRTLDANVTDYEPNGALFSGTDGLDLIRRICADAATHMNEGGELWLECDESNADQALTLARRSGAKRSELRTDPYGRKRLVVSYF